MLYSKYFSITKTVKSLAADAFSTMPLFEYAKSFREQCYKQFRLIGGLYCSLERVET